MRVILLEVNTIYGCMTKILAIVVTYYPDRDLLERNVSAFIDHVDKVLIWENTPEADKLSYRFLDHKKVEYCGDGINSISHGLNYGWKYAKNHAYDYLLTMDQDSLLKNFDSFLKKTVYDNNAPYGIWTPLINDGKNITTYQLMEMAITSGALIPVDIIDRVGGWNEFFSVDSVDTEFFSHVRSMDIGIFSVDDYLLIQHFGNPQTARFLWHSIELRNDSPDRLYYIYRNYVIAMRMYPENNTLSRGFRKVWLRKILWIALFEAKRIKKLYAIFRGIRDGFKYSIQ